MEKPAWSESGFNLIELMLVILLIGVLTALALPAYRAYMARAALSEGLDMAVSIQMNVSDYYRRTGAAPTGNVSAGAQAPSDLQGRYVNSITISASGDDMAIIKINYTVQTPGVSAGFATLRLTGTPGSMGDLNWACDRGTIDSRYVPGRCR